MGCRTAPTRWRNWSLGEGLALLVLLPELLQDDLPVPPQVALVPDLDQVGEYLVVPLVLELGDGHVQEHVLAENPLPTRVLVVVLPLAELERDPEVRLRVDAEVPSLEGVTDLCPR